MVEEDGTPPPLSVIGPGQDDPVLKRLQAPRTEAELDALAAKRAARVVHRERVWIRTFWIRAAILVLSGGAMVWWVNTMRPHDWRDLYLQPGVFAVLTGLAIWRGLPLLLVLPLLALVPVITVLVAGGDVPYWYVKVPILGGIGMGVACATPWPSTQE